jgi:hypothetical protein
MLTIRSIDKHVEQLFSVINRLAAALSQAEIPYRVVGGVAIYLHIEAVDPLAARLTRDVDVAVDRRDLNAIIEAVRPFGFEYRHAAGADVLVDAAQPEARSSVYLIEASPEASPPVETHGVPLAPIADLVRMKLTSFRQKDRVHLRDLDSVNLITPEIEAQLSKELRRRLRRVRASE